MNILNVEEIRAADNYTITHEPIASIDLMERASKALFNWIEERVDPSQPIHIYCGLGNNGGDGLALARMLATSGFQVDLYILCYSDKRSDDFQINFERLNGISGLNTKDINGTEDLELHEANDIIIDAIFGSGLARPVDGFLAEVIDHINQSPGICIAIDIPSGLFADTCSTTSPSHIVRADHSLSFQFPKLAFMLAENDAFVGQWDVLDIGLHKDYIDSVSTKNHFLLPMDFELMKKKRRKFSHKGSYGHALLISGEHGKIGAAILASRACLRSGVGLLHTHIPKTGSDIMQVACPEAMLSIDRFDNHFSEVPDLSPYSAIGIGPGLGLAEQSQMALKLLIQNYQGPMVFDADALNILSENKTWLGFIPQGSILSPHPKEFQRLAGSWKNGFECLDLQRRFASKYGVYLILKGAHTSVCFPDGQCFFNPSGNPGMATAGSGDVLTGVLTGLLAQAYEPSKAALLGVYLHGLAGDLAAENLGMDALIASDIVDHLADAFLSLQV